jgi:hypothetical protein
VCPLDHDRGVDAAVVVREGADAALGTGDWGAVCALRAGVPLVVVGAGDADPLVERAAAQAAAADVTGALEAAVAQGVTVQERAAGGEVERLLASAGVAGSSRVEVRRNGRDLRAMATLPVGADRATRDRIGAHLAGLLTRTDRWS